MKKRTDKTFVVILIITVSLLGFITGVNKYLKHHRFVIIDGQRVIQNLDKDGNVIMQEKPDETSYMQKMSMAGQGINGGKVKIVRFYPYEGGENSFYIIDTEKWRVLTHQKLEVGDKLNFVWDDKFKWWGIQVNKSKGWYFADRWTGIWSLIIINKYNKVTAMDHLTMEDYIEICLHK